MDIEVIKRRLIIFFIVLVFSPLLLFFFLFVSKAAPIKANIIIDVKKTSGPVPDRWKALAQGGEEKGVRMLQNVTSQVAGLYPRYIRLDHIYDYYDVASRDSSGKLVFDWTKLDQTVCDIYHTGAKPFFSLGYMPSALSGDETLISTPKNWDDWATLVQKTIEHYSGSASRLCGQISGIWTTDLYYEVWNEPDLESFGKWSIYGGKDYKTLYYYSAVGAAAAKNVNRFLLGGPATTALYDSWILRFLDYVDKNNLRLNFLSWHHYSKNANDYTEDARKLNQWLSDSKYVKFRTLPKVVSEWGFDSEPNPMAETEAGAAHTIASIRNFTDAGFELAFLFEIKDGQTPRWGILSHDGKQKPRYEALKLLNNLDGRRLIVAGEGTYVSALASATGNKINIILVNYDTNGKNTELVPVSLNNLPIGIYSVETTYLGEASTKVDNIQPIDGTIKRDVLMRPNSVVSLEIKNTRF